MLTRHVLAHLELLGNTLVDLLQRQAYLQPQVAASMLMSTGRTSSAKASEAVASKDVAKHREDVVHIHRTAAEASETASGAERSVESELVVLLPFLRVVQHIVSLSCLLELLFSLFVARVAVRMIFDGYLPIGLFDLFLGCRLADAQHLVIITLLSHGYCLLLSGYCPTATLAWRITLSLSL